ncbi:MaoC family dehydratase [Haloarcula marina]|uniref:MaoC family dehydratase n=1 Tax=Haloarcula marina TaxID=2961574 RepID=UPI0020B792FB|nr:MaoC family dehydratase [Halomicroarcula marina]
MKFFDDIEVGDAEEFGAYDVTKAEIIEFGEKYDPQPFHVDEGAAEESFFGELVASGWHTAAICMRLNVDRTKQSEIAARAGVGVDALRWHELVRPGDTLYLRTEVLEKRPSDGHSDRGYVTVSMAGVNQNDVVVISFEATIIVARDVASP